MRALTRNAMVATAASFLMANNPAFATTWSLPPLHMSDSAKVANAVSADEPIGVVKILSSGEETIAFGVNHQIPIPLPYLDVSPLVWFNGKLGHATLRVYSPPTAADGFSAITTWSPENQGTAIVLLSARDNHWYISQDPWSFHGGLVEPTQANWSFLSTLIPRIRQSLALNNLATRSQAIVIGYIGESQPCEPRNYRAQCYPVRILNVVAGTASDSTVLIRMTFPLERDRGAQLLFLRNGAVGLEMIGFQRGSCEIKADRVPRLDNLPLSEVLQRITAARTSLRREN